LLSAAGQIAQKKLTALDERVVTFWPQLVTTLTCLVIIEVKDSSWDYLSDMNVLCWFLMALNGFFIIGM
jgi:hypothetical protein